MTDQQIYCHPCRYRQINLDGPDLCEQTRGGLDRLKHCHEAIVACKGRYGQSKDLNDRNEDANSNQ